MSRIPSTVRRKVAERARWRCEYCQTQQILVVEMEIDHIRPVSAEGDDSLSNLCYSCASCNGAKSTHQTGRDPETGEQTRLFNPRVDSWRKHFQWSDDGVTLLGQTAIGNATIERLKINGPNQTASRRVWAAFGAHPPRD